MLFVHKHTPINLARPNAVGRATWKVTQEAEEDGLLNR